MELSTKLIEPFLGCPPEEYGELFHAHLLEQYKIYVQSAHQVSDRRETANNYLLTVNTTLVALYGIASGATGNHRWHLVLPIAGLLVCLTWYSLVRAYRDLNTAKFRIIHELEEHLPAALF